MVDLYLHSKILNLISITVKRITRQLHLEIVNFHMGLPSPALVCSRIQVKLRNILRRKVHRKPVTRFRKIKMLCTAMA